MIADGFVKQNLPTSTLVTELRDEKKDHLRAFTKSTGLIKEFVDKSLHPLLHEKTAQEMWTILATHFHLIFPMIVTRIFTDVCNVKLLDYKDVLDYTSCYQIAFDKLISLIFTEGWMSRKTVEMTLQGSFFRYLGQNYSALASAIETG